MDKWSGQWKLEAYSEIRGWNRAVIVIQPGPDARAPGLSLQMIDQQLRWCLWDPEQPWGPDWQPLTD
uniref:Uncharacterized protein n=1 Tax=viral metagenome TaxID=1070528 RepID=A0A6M3LRC0_9ZZZZ